MVSLLTPLLSSWLSPLMLLVGLFGAPAVEWCNGADDDGDGAVDEGFECSPGAGAACETPCGSEGRRQCSAACTWLSCDPGDEVCNGEDDDCDGHLDEGFDCPAGQRVHCTTEQGVPGRAACGEDCRLGRCDALPGEFCNGLDDDGDGAADEDFECLHFEVGACGSGEAPGKRMCTAACTWGACEIPEVCNYRDDNGDGRIDEGTEWVALLEREIEPQLVTPGAWSFECGADRVAYMPSRTHISIIRDDGTELSLFRVCDDPALDFAEVRLRWWGDNLVVSCSWHDLLRLWIYDQGGRVVTGPVDRVTDFYAPWDIRADGDRLGLFYTRGVVPDREVTLEHLDMDLEPVHEPIATGIPPLSTDEEVDYMNLQLGYDDDGPVLFAIQLQPELRDGDFVLSVYMYRVDMARGVVGQGREIFPGARYLYSVHRFGEGWGAIVDGRVAIFDNDGDVLGTMMPPGGDDGGIAWAGERYRRYKMVGGVGGGSYVVQWPGNVTSRYSRDGRLNGTWVLPHPQDGPGVFSVARRGCTLPDGRMLSLVHAFGERDNGIQQPGRRWVSVAGCPEG